MNNDLKLIKKDYGEDMMHFCRDNFPTLIEKNLLYKAIHEKFYKNKYLYRDLKAQNMLEEFVLFITAPYTSSISDRIKTDKTPFELMDEAGYTLYECKTESDIQKFKKYYAQGEALCTFNDSKRLDNCHVFFAVKNNIDEIKRVDFIHPERQDQYGTSVISIQFTHGNLNMVSIKNRYNHTVYNPDATFSNNLDKIIPGLKYSFEKHYDLNVIDHYYDEFEPYYYTIGPDGKYYKYNYELNNIYYCPDNIILTPFEIDYSYTGENSARYIVFDYFILDIKKKLLKVYKYPPINTDSFLNIYDDIISDIKIEKGSRFKNIIITTNKGISIITINELNRMIKYKNNYIEEIDNSFLVYDKYLEEIEMNNVVKIGNSFIPRDRLLSLINLKNVKYIGDEFLTHASNLTEISFLNLEIVGNRFLGFGSSIEKMYLSSLRKIGDYFLGLNDNNKLLKIDLPNVEIIGDYFLNMCHLLEEIYAPKVLRIGNDFIRTSKKIKKVELESVERIGDDFLVEAFNIEEAYFPNLKYIGNWFLSQCKCKTIQLPKVISIGSFFMGCNEDLANISLDSAEIIGDRFLFSDEELQNINIPNVKIIGDYFLTSALKLEKLNIPEARRIGEAFVRNNSSLKELSADKLECIDNDFLPKNRSLVRLNLKSAQFIGDNCLKENETLEHFDLPNVVEIGSNFLLMNNKVEIIYAPKLNCVEDCFMMQNWALREAYFPSLESVGNYFLNSAENLEIFEVPNLEDYGEEFILDSHIYVKNKITNKVKVKK